MENFLLLQATPIASPPKCWSVSSFVLTSSPIYMPNYYNYGLPYTSGFTAPFSKINIHIYVPCAFINSPSSLSKLPLFHFILGVTSHLNKALSLLLFSAQPLLHYLFSLFKNSHPFHKHQSLLPLAVWLVFSR